MERTKFMQMNESLEAGCLHSRHASITRVFHRDPIVLRFAESRNFLLIRRRDLASRFGVEGAKHPNPKALHPKA